MNYASVLKKNLQYIEEWAVPYIEFQHIIIDIKIFILMKYFQIL